MAKFDSQYPLQISPEDGDKILIAAAQDGSIMALPFGRVMGYIQKYLNQIDDELSPTSLHPVQNRVITQAINDILAQLQPTDDKEIIPVLTYSETAPENAEEGEFYINSLDDHLWKWEDGSGWISEGDEQENVIYLTNDTTHFYVYQTGVFIDMTGQPIDNTIYINDLNELDGFLEEGIYRVCHTNQVTTRKIVKWYTFIIEKTINTHPLRTDTTQTLSNRSGYKIRKKNNTGPWQAWEEFIFASKAELDDAWKYMKKNRKMAKAAL